MQRGRCVQRALEPGEALHVGDLGEWLLGAVEDLERAPGHLEVEEVERVHPQVEAEPPPARRRGRRSYVVCLFAAGLRVAGAWSEQQRRGIVVVVVDRLAAGLRLLRQLVVVVVARLDKLAVGPAGEGGEANIGEDQDRGPRDQQERREEVERG